jgi:hypothetical protein
MSSDPARAKGADLGFDEDLESGRAEHAARSDRW